MPSIQSLGVGSGLLTTEVVDDLVAAERKTVDLRLDLQTSEYEAEISAFGSITSAVEGLRSATSALTARGATDSLKATSSDSALSASVTSVAEAGTYSVVVNQLAQSHSLVSKSYDSITDIVGTGELTFRFGTTTYSGTDYDSFALDTAKTSKTLTIDSSNNTLSSLRSAINNGDFGVRATIVNDGEGFRLLLSTEDAGASNSMEILVAGDAGSGLKALAYNSDYNGAAAVGAISEGGSVDLSSGIDFSTTNASFSLTVGAVSGINVTVNQDATTDLGGGGGTQADNLIAIQAALDSALVAKGLAAGDVIASVDDNDGGLILTTLATGSSAAIEITADDGVLGLNPNLGARYGSDGSMTETQAGQSASLTINGLAVTRESNAVAEVINGVTLNLSGADAGKTISLSIAHDTSAIVEKVQNFIDKFNELKVLSDEATAFNLDTGESGILLGDSTLRTINSRMRNIMNSVVDGIVGSKFRTLAEVGIYTNQDNSFLLELDTARLNEAIAENSDAIKSLFSTNTSSSDPLIEVINTGVNTQPGSYAVEVTQLATQGVYQGDTNVALDTNVVIDDDNDT
ncbi:MAG: flagellar filament capping protein FliD, partial [Pseudomonadales bacterium]|nr:flagellar filament capping protein FliD [Pseudomonadales bacterium]